MNRILSKQKRVRRKRRYPDRTPQWMFCEILGSVVVMAGISLITFLMLFL